MLYLLFLCAFAISFCGVWLFKKYAIKFGVLDVVNNRSLHSGEIPRGGGVILILLFALYGGIQLARVDGAPQNQILWLSCCAAVSALGFVDDLKDLSARARLLVQIFIAIVFCLFAQDMIFVGSILGLLALAVFLIWQINAINFMDGIDGLVASQAILIGLYLFAMSNPSADDLYSSSLLVFCAGTLGFLCWNWNGASVFLGDVGSYFIGFFIGSFILLTTDNLSGFLAKVIVLLPLQADASFTLCARIMQKKNIFAAHRDHVYQLFAGNGVSHARVAGSWLAINAFIFVPLSVAALLKPDHSIEIFCFSGVLAGLIWYFARSVAKNQSRVV